MLRRPWDLLHHPLWADESWVALSVRLPFTAIREVTATSPIGFTALLRLVPGSEANQRLRLIPLVFSLATVLPAYVVGHRIFSSRVAGAVLALSMACAPPLLVHRDLKQYSADAFVAVTALALLLRAETGERRTTFQLAGFLSVALLISHAALLVGAAAWGSLLLVAAVRRRWDRLRLAAVGLGLLLLSFAVVYLLFDRRGQTAALDYHWRDYWPPGHVSAWPRFFVVHAWHATTRSGVHPAVLALLGIVVGGVALWHRGHVVTAVFVPVLLVELMAAAAAHRYPFLDERTSTFVSTLLVLQVAIGVVWLVQGARLAPRPSALTVGRVLIGVALLISLLGGTDSASHSQLTLEDVRSQVHYLEHARRPGEPVVVPYSDTDNFAWYWRSAVLARPSQEFTTLNWRVELHPSTDVVLARGSSERAQCAALRAALDSGAARIWLVGGRPTGNRLPELARSYGRLTKVMSTPGTRLVLVAVRSRDHGACG